MSNKDLILIFEVLQLISKKIVSFTDRNIEARLKELKESK